MKIARFALMLAWFGAGGVRAIADASSAWDRLLAERDSLEAFEQAVEHAASAGVAEQAILEARFLYEVDAGDDTRIAALAPEFAARRETFNPAQSHIFATKKDWLAVVEYTQAIAAITREDHAAFKKHITEAFWLSPQQGVVFAAHIERHHIAMAMKELRFDFDLTLEDLLENPPKNLSVLNANRVATLLTFWSPWSIECESMIATYLGIAKDLEDQQVAAIAILPEQSAEAIATARNLLEEFGTGLPGHWLMDRKQEPIAAILHVRELPSCILLDPNGKVIYNGHPESAGFWNTMKKMIPSATTPKHE